MAKKIALAVLILVLLIAAYFYLALSWSYSTGERAGWIQKLSNKGWICKTWEGELALVSLPGSVTIEKFFFTVRDDAVADEIAKVMGSRVTLHYEEKVGLPTTCFGETRYYVTSVTLANDIPITQGVSVPAQKPGQAPQPAAPQPPAQPPAQAPAPQPAAPQPATPY